MTQKDNGREIQKTLRSFIEESFLAFADVDDYDNSDSFMEKGIIDSTGILELIAFLEGTYDITVEDEELIPENLDSIAKVAQFLQRKLAAAEPQA